jgi:methionyl-tRNA formyltransferase
LNVVFFGTPDFAVPSLRRLADDPGLRVCLVVSQPDKPAGRRQSLAIPPVARLARERGLPLSQPEKLRENARFFDELRSLSPDIFAVVAYGRLFPAELLEIPRLACVNLHASLLPRHRGASPIQSAILQGDHVTGVTTMRMTEGLDEGPIYLTREIPILDSDTAGSLSEKLSREGAELLTETIGGIAARRLNPAPQRGEPTFCRPIRRGDGEIRWEEPAEEIVRAWRAYTPWPGVFTTLGSERVKLDHLRAGGALSGPPGSARACVEGLQIASGAATSVIAAEIQREGKKQMTAANFLRGFPAGALRFGAA